MHTIVVLQSYDKNRNTFILPLYLLFQHQSFHALWDEISGPQSPVIYLAPRHMHLIGTFMQVKHGIHHIGK